jgi:2'-5' RNA ligase
VSDTAVLVRVPESEPVVREWRLRHTYDAPLGIPAHVTLLFPWVPADELDDATEERLAQILRKTEPFDVAFARTARFPAVLYLEPQPPERFSALTEAIAAEWPEHPPYAGEHETVIPHLTVAESEDDELLERIRAAVDPQLPVKTRVTEAELFEEDPDGRWHERRRFPLAS